MHPSYFPKTIPCSDIPLPSTGSRPMSVPPLQRYYQDATTPCLSSRRTSFPSLGDTTVASSVRSVAARDAKATRPGVFSLLPGHSAKAACVRGKGRISQVPAEPRSPVCTCSSTPAEPTRDSPIAPRPAWPPLRETQGLQRTRLLKLNDTASRLAVYASQAGSPRHHARLASGCWLDSTAWDSHPQGPNERFQLLIPHQHPPFASFLARSPFLPSFSSLHVGQCATDVVPRRFAWDGSAFGNPRRAELALHGSSYRWATRPAVFPEESRIACNGHHPTRAL